MNKYIFIFLFLFKISNIQSQKIEYKSYFIEDSTKIGDSIRLVTILKYPNNIEIIQPDSSYKFSSFDFIGKKIFPSIVSKNIISDSTIYFLRTFEIDSIQKINLKANIIGGNDSMSILSDTDSIYIINQVNNLTSQSKENTLLSKIKSIFNTEKAFYITVGILLFLIIIFISFRKKIIRYFKIRKIKKQIKSFNEEFSYCLKKYSQKNNPKELEKLLLLWKRFMENFTKKPYSSSTTMEISSFNDDTEMMDILHKSDKSIYSGSNLPIETSDLNKLQLKANTISKDKINQILDGKE